MAWHHEACGAGSRKGQQPGPKRATTIPVLGRASPVCVGVCVSGHAMPHTCTHTRTHAERKRRNRVARTGEFPLPSSPAACDTTRRIRVRHKQPVTPLHSAPPTTHHTPPAPLYLAHPSLFFSHVRQQVQRKRGSKQRMQPSWEKVEKRRRGGGPSFAADVHCTHASVARLRRSLLARWRGLLSPRPPRLPRPPPLQGQKIIIIIHPTQRQDIELA